MRPSVKERARAFIAKARCAVSGQDGHGATFAAACALVVGFGLDDSDAWELLQVYNATSCTPAWPEKDLRRKLSEARKQADRNPSEVGKMAAQDAPNYTGPSLPPSNKPQSKGGAPPRAPGQPQPMGTVRTRRTPYFHIRRKGEGAGARDARTLRTLPTLSKLYEKKEAHTDMVKSENAASGMSGVSEKPKPQRASEPSAPVKPAALVKPQPSEPSEKIVKEETPKPKASEPSGIPEALKAQVEGLLVCELTSPRKILPEPVDRTCAMKSGEVWRKPWRGQWRQIENPQHTPTCPNKR